MSKGIAFLMKKNKIEVIKGAAKLAGKGKISVTGEDGKAQIVEADHTILATGSRSRELPNVKIDGKHVIGYREAMVLPKQPKELIIIGSGAIGMEFAYFYASIGTKVTIVEFMPRILPIEDEEVSKAMAMVYKKRGIEILTESSVEAVEIKKDRCKVTVKTKNGEVSLESDIVLSAAGVQTNLENLGLEEMGIKSDKGKVVVDMSSISPIATKEFAKKINDLGCDYLDAPVSGGEVGAKNATLSIMVGGDESVFNKVKPVFELMGKNINLVGGNGDGQTAKVANQIIVALNIEAVAEALVFAAKAGADPAKVRQALMGGFAGSKILEVHGERMVKRTFDPGFRIELHQKDLNLALNSARVLGVSLPNTATAQELFNSCAAHGGKAWDHSAMVKALENLANFEIGQKA